METKFENNNELVTEDKANTTKSKLLELRKAQAKELAALKDVNFSIDEELKNIREMLVNEDIDLEVQVDDSMGKSDDLVTMPEDNKTTIKDTPAKTQSKSKLQLEKEKEKEKLRLQKEKEKEKLRLQKQKEKEREKLRLQKQKEKEREKLRLQKQKEKEREKLRLQKQKEKEREKLRLQKDKEKEKLRLQKTTASTPIGTYKRKITSNNSLKTSQKEENVNKDEIIIYNDNTEGKATNITMSEDKKSDVLDQEVNSSNDVLVDSEEEAKKFFGNSKPSTFANILEKPMEKKESGIIDNLQRLREQIMAQKRLERELMEVEAMNVQKKELSLKTKLTELEGLVREEEQKDHNEELIAELENTKLELTQELEFEKEKVSKLLSITYSNINVIDPDTLTLSNTFLDSITAVSAEELYSELEAVQNELTELREIHEINRRSIMEKSAQTVESMVNSEKYLELFNKLRSDIENYREKSIELEKQLSEVKQINEKFLFEENDRIEKAIIKKQNELDIKYLNKEADLISEYEIKIDEIRNSLKAKLNENVMKAKLGLEAKYKGKLRDQSTLERELKRQTDKLGESTKTIDKLTYDLMISQNEINVKVEQISYLESKLLDLNKKVNINEVKGLQDKIITLEEEIAKQKTEINNLTSSQDAKNQEIEKLYLELDEVEKLVNARITQEYQELILKLEIELEEKVNEVDSLTKKLEELNNDELHEELAKLNYEKEQLVIEVENQKQIINELTNEIDALKENSSNNIIDNSEQYLKQIEDLQNQSKESEEGYITLKNQLVEVKQELDISNNKLFNLQNDYNNVYTELLDANTSLEKALVDNGNLSEKLQDITNDYSLSEAELVKMANELEVIKENQYNSDDNNIRKVNEEIYNMQSNIESLKNGYEVQIAGFQEQINELTSLLSTQKLELESKINEVFELKNVIQNIEDNQVEEIDSPNTEDFSNNRVNEDIQKLIETYTKERDLLAYKHNNDINKLEIEKKFTTNPLVIERINSDIMELTNKFQQTNIRNESKLQASIQSIIGYSELTDNSNNDGYDNDITISEEPSQDFESNMTNDSVIIEDSQEIELESNQEESVQESNEKESFQEIKNEFDTEFVEESADVDSEDDLEEKLVEESVQNETINDLEQDFIEEDGLDQNDLHLLDGVELVEETTLSSHDEIKSSEQSSSEQSPFGGIVDQEYLNRLNNIHRMKRNLESKKEEYLNDYELVSEDTDANQEELKRKIAEIKARINLLEQEYRNNRGYHPDREREFENQKTKFYLELETRQEQLRKTVEEENRLRGLKYKNLIKNIDEQLVTLDEEEQQLKEYYLNKQNKLQSKINRENEILEKLQKEKQEAKIEEIRFIESQEEIKERFLKDNPAIEASDHEIRDEINEFEQDFESENQTQEVDFVDPVDNNNGKEKLSSINVKEQELLKLYNKFANAEAVLVRENKHVREYKNIKNEILAYGAENKRLNENIEKLTSSLENASLEDAESVKDQIKQHEVRKNLISKRVSYLDKQLINMEANGYVQEYCRVVEKLDSMEDILQKYQEVKQGLQ